MLVAAEMAGTPQYVLLNENRPIGPKLVQTAETTYTAIYGFSAKSLYDNYCKNNEMMLKPYPLVKGYLRNQVKAQRDTVRLVVLDSAGLGERCLRAATMKAVLAALESRENLVCVAYRLLFDDEAGAFRVEQVAL